MSARRIRWSRFPVMAVPRTQVCERVGANAARNLIADLGTHREELMQRLADRTGPIARRGRRLGQFRRDMEALIAPTLCLARAPDAWHCMMPTPHPNRGTDQQIGIERIDHEGMGGLMDLRLSAHAIARLAQRGIGTDPDMLLEGVRTALRAVMRLEGRPECRRSRMDLEARVPSRFGTWAAIRQRGAWTVTTFLDSRAIDAPCIQALRHEQERAEGLAASKRFAQGDRPAFRARESLTA